MRRAAWVGALALAAVWPVATPRADAAEPLTLAFTGDVSVAGRRAPKDRKRVAPDENPLRAFASIFAAADISVTNAEGLFMARDPASYGRSRLDITARPVWAPIFSDAQLDVVSTANNHSWDGGAAGLLESLGHLQATGVTVIGSGPTRAAATAPHRVTIDGTCIAIVPATLKSNRGRRRGAAAAYYRASEVEALVARVTALRDEGCFVAVYVHWGREGVHHPRKRDVAVAHALVKAGAGLVVGHHPHVLQGVEWVGDAAIAYSLGNFVFTNRTPAKRETGVLWAEVNRGPAPTLARLRWIPATVRLPGFAPTPDTGAEIDEARENMARYSEAFGTRVERVHDRLEFRRP